MSDKPLQGPPSSVGEVLAIIRKLDVKQISDWLTLSLKVAGGIGGFLLVAYAARERFFYDLSSLAALSLLLLVVLLFSFLVLAASIYGTVSFLGIVAILFCAVSWIMRCCGHPVKVRLRPFITKWRIVFSMILFCYIVILVLAKPTAHWVVLEWAALAGWAVACLIATEPIFRARTFHGRFGSLVSRQSFCFS
jgi:hypothetical protein